MKRTEVTVSVEVENVRFDRGLDLAVGSIQRGFVGYWDAVILRLIPNLHGVCSGGEQGVGTMMVDRAGGIHIDTFEKPGYTKLLT